MSEVSGPCPVFLDTLDTGTHDCVRLCPVVSEMSSGVSEKCPILVSGGVRVVSGVVSEMSGLCPKRCPKCPVGAQNTNSAG